MAAAISTTPTHATPTLVTSAATTATSARVRGVTFDLDDTLWCGATVIRRATDAFHAFLAARAPRLATAFPPSTFYALLGELQRERPDKAHDYTFLRKLALRRCVAGGWTDEDSNQPQQMEAAREAFLEEAFQAFLIPRSEPEFFDGVEELLQQLHTELRSETEADTTHVAMGVITNGNCLLERLPAFFQLHMDFMVSAESVGIAKPAAAIFDAAYAHFPTGIARHAIVHVGDHYTADVVGAKRAGFRTIWIDAARAKPDAVHRRCMDADDAARFPEADAIVTHVRAVGAVIHEWNREARDAQSQVTKVTNAQETERHTRITMANA